MFNVIASLKFPLIYSRCDEIWKWSFLSVWAFRVNVKSVMWAHDSGALFEGSGGHETSKAVGLIERPCPLSKLGESLGSGH